MSNALAVPAVTAALSTIVQSAVDACGLHPGAIVSPRLLRDSSDIPTVGVHLYRVTHDPALSAIGLPGSPSGADPGQPPHVALNLHYLISLRGNTEWETQQLAAACAAMLHVVPILTAKHFADAEAEHPQITGHDLIAARNQVRITPDKLSIEELNGVWALYPPGSFALTLAVSAGPVLVNGDSVASGAG